MNKPRQPTGFAHQKGEGAFHHAIYTYTVAVGSPHRVDECLLSAATALRVMRTPCLKPQSTQNFQGNRIKMAEASTPR